MEDLPPGFRFFPTDEELIVHFLKRKAAVLPSHPRLIIPDLSLFTYDPWELQGKALEEGRRWYFYSRRSRERTTSSGYWKPYGAEEPVISSGERVGTKKYFVFHLEDGAATNWAMHEFRLVGRRTRVQEEYSKWVVCRVMEGEETESSEELSGMDELFLSLDDDDEYLEGMSLPPAYD